MKATIDFTDLQEDQLHSIDDVCSALEKLNKELENTSLQGLQNFNQAYLIITRNVKIAMRAGYFEDPIFLEKFDRKFASYYISALQKYLSKQHTPPAWRNTFEACLSSSTTPLKRMALGVNAHVNNDIAQVLHDCQARDYHYRDYKTVNKVIQHSVDEVINGLHDSTSRMRPSRTLLRPAYKIGMNIVIRWWRAEAWRHYRAISTHEQTRQDIENHASSMSKTTQHLPI